MGLRGCVPGMVGAQTRPWLLTEIEARVGQSSTNSPTHEAEILNHITRHRSDRNCKGNFNDGTGDCAPIGVVDCPCFSAAYNAAMMGDWATCSTKLAHGH